MADYTANMDMIKPDSSDVVEPFSRESMNDNLDKIDAAITGLLTALGGLSFEVTTLAEYDGTEHSAMTVYILTDIGKLYIGDIPLGGGGGMTAGEAIRIADGVTRAVSGQAQTIEQEG